MRPGGVGPPAYRAKPSDQRPSQRAPGPQPSESQRARGGHPTPSDAGLRPTLSQASSTAPQRQPGYRPAFRTGSLSACPPGVACPGAARGPRPQVLGPRPGIAWGRLFHVSTPTRAVSRRTAVMCAPSESVPRGARAVSAPRAVGCVLMAWNRLLTEPSRATSVPASGPRVPGRANLSVPGAATRPPATRAFAPRSAKHPPPRHSLRPGTDPDPGPRLRHWGLRHWPTRRARGG